MYKIIKHMKEAMRPMKMPADESAWKVARAIDKRRVQTWSKELVLVKQRCVAIRLGGARVGGVGGVVALEFHANRLRISVLGLVDDGVRFGELSR